MNIKQRLIRALLRLYPEGWRREYGPELSDLLHAGPLHAHIVVDVLKSGVRERARGADSAALVGLGGFLAVSGAIAWNIVAPLPYGAGWTDVLRPSSLTLPTIIVAPLASDASLLSFGAFGCWLALRHGTRPWTTGLATLRIGVLAGLPVIIAGLLITTGLLGVVALGPGDVPGTFDAQGFALTYYDADRQVPSGVAVLVAPLFRLPELWLWGALGGWVGMRIAHRRPACA